MQTARAATLASVTLAALLIPVSAAQAAVAAFSYSPEAPLSGELVTFTSHSTGTITSEEWDLDGDGSCDDATGPSAQRSFALPGSYAVRLCVNNGESTLQQTLSVGDRAPAASIAYAPADPVAGERVTLTSTSVDPDGPIFGHSWGFGDDGVADDATGVTITRSWAAAGVYPVFLRVVDGFGAAGDAIAWIPVARRPARLLSPFPVVRLVGRLTETGAQISALVVQAPRGARVAVRCRGLDCPYRKVATRSDGSVRLRKLQRSLDAGTVIELSVTKRGMVGKWTRFVIRRGERPKRVDRCLKPGATKPAACPSS